MQLSFAPVISRQDPLCGLRVIIDDRIMPSCACQDAVQLKEADHRCT